jgi:hypothetical protein
VAGSTTDGAGLATVAEAALDIELGRSRGPAHLCRSDDWQAKIGSIQPSVQLVRRPATGSPWLVVTYLRGSLRLSRQIYLSGILENLTNDTYRIHGSGIPGPGLGAHLTLEGNL